MFFSLWGQTETVLPLLFRRSSRCTSLLLPHSHSNIFIHGNALIFQRKFFLRVAKHRLHDPSEIFALDFEREFRKFGICSVSATIEIDWSIFL